VVRLTTLANSLRTSYWPQETLITGGTGTGKTTLVNILGKFIPPERDSFIEDTSEIQMDQGNRRSFRARQPQNAYGSQHPRLLKASLRHRPDADHLGR